MLFLFLSERPKVFKDIILKVAEELGYSGDMNFFLGLGLTLQQFQNAERNHQNREKNFVCLQEWCRKEGVEKATVKRLKQELRRSERLDIIQEIERLEKENSAAAEGGENDAAQQAEEDA